MENQNKLSDKRLLSKERTVGNEFRNFSKFQLWRYCMALEEIERTDTVLDIGCGVGYGSKIISNKAQKVVAIDDSLETIKYAKKYHSKDNIEYKCLDIFNIALTKVFDIIIAYEIIEHIKDSDKLLELFWKLTRKKLLITTPELCDTPTNKFHWKRWKKDELETKLLQIGFKIKTSTKIEIDKKTSIFIISEK